MAIETERTTHIATADGARFFVTLHNLLFHTIYETSAKYLCGILSMNCVCVFASQLDCGLLQYRTSIKISLITVAEIRYTAQESG